MTGLISVWKYFSIFRMLTRLVRLISTMIKEEVICSHLCIRCVDRIFSEFTDVINPREMLGEYSKSL